ncbi:hypothetical protein SAMN06265173_1097 [Thalassovita litoralis]|jgi:hypothetical protein|uniref:Uncharacterized protein n=1 Tax=Thalassovita litoralis TaxID=1010611 RepID=A0A521D5G4_9RHOB|nr:hypothetical protein SAMN06265173_1097 [Thalassovita litoralis]
MALRLVDIPDYAGQTVQGGSNPPQVQRLSEIPKP